MNVSVKDLLKKNVADYREPPKFPAANYRFIITGWHLLTWAKSGKYGVAFNYKPTACFEADDDSNPELQAEIQKQLEEYGDWLAKEFGQNATWYLTREEPKAKHLMVSDITFTLYNTDGSDSAGASMFYLNKDGVQSGFAHDVLGIDRPAGGELGDLLEECVNKEFCGQMVYEANSDPQRPANLKLQSVTRA